MTFHFPADVLRQHMAFLGKTGSGKTSTAKVAVEQIVRADPAARVCVLDAIKSDWWGLTSSADGKRAGLPFVILGGPRGHVALHSGAGKAIGELVASGALPLSIIDMADFKAGGLQQFFIDFAEALFKKNRGVVYLVMEEAHEFAPKERSGIGAENLAIHWAKKLATGARSKGIRLILVTQRTQSLHNALLGSCDTMVAHRLTAPADQNPVKDWLKANMPKEVFAEVADSMSRLKTGSGWFCSGEAARAELVTFPRITTFDNSATPDGSAETQVTTAAVDRERLKSIIGTAVEEAERDDPAKLRAQLDKLSAENESLRYRTGITPEQHKRIYDSGYEDGYGQGGDKTMRAVASLVGDLTESMGRAETACADAKRLLASFSGFAEEIAQHKTPPAAALAASPRHQPPPAPRQPAKDTGLGGAEQKIIDAIRWWNVIGVAAPSHPQAAFVAGYSHKSGTWATYLSRLRSAGLIEGRGDLVLTGEGLSKANNPGTPPTGVELRQIVLAKIDAPLAKILGPILTIYPRALSHEEAGRSAGYSHSSGTWATYLSRLRSLDLIDGRGELRAQDWLFP